MNHNNAILSVTRRQKQKSHRAADVISDETFRRLKEKYQSESESNRL